MMIHLLKKKLNLKTINKILLRLIIFNNIYNTEIRFQKIKSNLFNKKT